MEFGGAELSLSIAFKSTAFFLDAAPASALVFAGSDLAAAGAELGEGGGIGAGGAGFAP